MRVVHVYKDYEPPVFGGIEHTLRLLSEGLAAREGMEVVVLCSSDRPTTREERMGGVHVVRAATFGRVARTPVSPTLARWIGKLRPDVLHFHHPNPTGELACLLARPRCPVVLTYYCDIVRQKRLLTLYRHPLRRFLKRADRILVPTSATLEDNPFLAPHRSRCEVVPLGIRPGDLAETPRAREVSERLRGSHPGPRVLFVGRMRPYKGLPVLLEAIERIDATLLLVGSGETEEEVKRIVRERGLDRRVVLAGDVPAKDLPGYYRAADLFVLPSINRSEAFGVAMVEAMHCGLPVISTRVGTGTSHVNREGVTGLEVPPGDPVALANAIRWMLERPEERKRMGMAGSDHARRFSEQAMVDRIAGVYAELLGSTRDSRQPGRRAKDAGARGSAVA